MDILISSNLERLLFALSDDTSVRAWMEQLKTNGKFDVGADLLSLIREDYACGYAEDDEAKSSIKRLFLDSGYLMDTHTAAACSVISKMRMTDEIYPTILVSTASPFKFCDSVLDALGENTSRSGAELIEILSAVTGAPIPKPLRNLASREARFLNCVS
jgi:threonine synthase